MSTLLRSFALLLGLAYGATALAGGAITWTKALGTNLGLFDIRADAAGNAYVIAATLDKLWKLDGGGNVVWSVSTGDNPRGLAVDASGNVYVANYTAATIQKFNSSGTLQWTSSASFSGASGVAIDSQGNILVASYSSQSITKLDPTGTTTLWSVSPGAGPYPVIVDANDNVFTVTSNLSGTLRKYNSAGVQQWSKAFSYGRYLALDSAGNIYVTSPTSGKVAKYDTNGNVLWSITTIAYPWGVAVDPNGNVLVTKGSAGAAYVLNSAGVEQWSLTTAGNLQGAVAIPGGGFYTANYTASTSNVLRVSYTTGCSSPRAFPVVFPHPYVTAGSSQIKASDFVSLMADINYLRTDAGLANCTWTKTQEPGTTGSGRPTKSIYASDINDLRACLAAVYTTCSGACNATGLCSTWNTTALAGSTAIKASDINDLIYGINNAP